MNARPRRAVGTGLGAAPSSTLKLSSVDTLSGVGRSFRFASDANRKVRATPDISSTELNSGIRASLHPPVPFQPVGAAHLALIPGEHAGRTRPLERARHGVADVPGRA